MAAPSGDVHPCCHGRVYEAICGAAGLLSGERLACNRLRDHRVDLGGVKGASG